MWENVIRLFTYFFERKLNIFLFTPFYSQIIGKFCYLLQLYSAQLQIFVQTNTKNMTDNIVNSFGSVKSAVNINLEHCSMIEENAQMEVQKNQHLKEQQNISKAVRSIIKTYLNKQGKRRIKRAKRVNQMLNQNTNVKQLNKKNLHVDSQQLQQIYQKYIQCKTKTKLINRNASFKEKINLKNVQPVENTKHTQQKNLKQIYNCLFYENGINQKYKQIFYKEVNPSKEVQNRIKHQIDEQIALRPTQQPQEACDQQKPTHPQKSNFNQKQKQQIGKKQNKNKIPLQINQKIRTFTLNKIIQFDISFINFLQKINSENLLLASIIKSRFNKPANLLLVQKNYYHFINQINIHLKILAQTSQNPVSIKTLIENIQSISLLNGNRFFSRKICCQMIDQQQSIRQKTSQKVKQSQELNDKIINIQIIKDNTYLKFIISDFLENLFKIVQRWIDSNKALVGQIIQLKFQSVCQKTKKFKVDFLELSEDLKILGQTYEKLKTIKTGITILNNYNIKLTDYQKNYNYNNKKYGKRYIDSSFKEEFYKKQLHKQILYPEVENLQQITSFAWNLNFPQPKQSQKINHQEDKRRAKKIVQFLILMQPKADVMELSELCRPAIRKELKKALDAGLLKYNYPKGFFDIGNNVWTTLILSKRPVKFGQIQYNYRDRNGWFWRRKNTFIEFDIEINNKPQTFRIVAAHLRANRKDQYNHDQRKAQILSLLQFGKQCSILSMQGDTNIGSNSLRKDTTYIQEELFFKRCGFEDLLKQNVEAEENCTYQFSGFWERLDRVLNYSPKFSDIITGSVEAFSRIMGEYYEQFSDHKPILSKLALIQQK